MTFGALWRRRRLILAITGASAVASIVISLLLPNWYRAETRLLLPGRAASGLIAGLAAGNLPTAASSLLGGITGDYQRHLSILDSRTVKENVVRQFNLPEVYDLKDSDAPPFRALEKLEENIEFIVHEEYNYLVVRVYDRDPQRAADMANFFVDELNRINALLASQNAGAYREKVEQRYMVMEASLDSVNSAVRDLQARSGVINLAAQTEAFMTGIAEWRLNIVMAEVEYDRLYFLYGPDNSIVRSAQSAVASANKRYLAAIAGAERMMPVPQDSLPDLALQFVDLEKDRMVFSRIIEYMRPVLEESRLEEQRKQEAVQVVDLAVPPVEKAKPFRALIVVASTMSGFLLAALFVILAAWWRQGYARIAHRLRTSGSSP